MRLVSLECTGRTNISHLPVSETGLCVKTCFTLLVVYRDINLTWLFLWTICKLWLKIIVVSDDANSVPNIYHCKRSMFVRMIQRMIYMYTVCLSLYWTVPSIWWTAEQQLLHITSFLSVIYHIAILNTSVNLERNETCLVRNETGGGTVTYLWAVKYCTNFKPTFLIVQW